MLPTIAETFLPSYSLEQTSSTGSTQFEIVHHSGLTRQQKELFFVPHRKNFYLLAFIKSANMRHWIDMVPYTVKPDAFYFSSPQQVFLKEDGVLEAIAISFTDEFLALEEGSLFQNLPIIQNPHNGHELNLSPSDLVFVEDLCGKLLAEYSAGQGWRNSMLLGYLRVLLIYLSRLYSEQFPGGDAAPGRELLRRFQDLIGVHFTEHHEVAAYAEMLSLSAGHFSELVKKQSGKTAIAHIHDRLLLEAKRLLFHSDASIKEIAWQLGFEEPTYFTRFFKRLAGSTPLSYRSAIREMYH